ncbi:MAG: glutathione S-transferase [Xanthomonadales bacterium]|nr:glutathione S-transferase [Xanthomonadales bacterium]
MLTVHHLENSRSQRILWLLEELELDYEIKRYQRDKVTSLAPPELRAVHPLGKSPVITDDDVTVAESGLIVEYLIETYGNGRLMPPVGTPENMQYRYWLHYAEGTFMPLMLISLLMNRIETAPVPFFIKPITKTIAAKAMAGYAGPNIKLNLDYLEATLQHTPWFCGDEMTGADIIMSFPIEAAATRTSLSKDYPALMAFHQRIRVLPAYQRAIERGGPYDY